MTASNYGAEVAVQEWLQTQLMEKSVEQVARELGVLQSLLIRNADRLRIGRPLTPAFSKALQVARNESRCADPGL